MLLTIQVSFIVLILAFYNWFAKLPTKELRKNNRKEQNNEIEEAIKREGRQKARN